jgi:hypothetical protein
MYGTQRGTQWGYSLWEFEVYGGSGPSPTATPVPPTNTPTPGPTATPSGDLVISNLTVASGKTYEVDANLQNGDNVYIDRGYTWTNVGSYAGEQFIRTANNDKGASDSSFLSFDVNQDVKVYVAFDERAGSDIPGWLSSWTATGEVLGTSDVNRDVYVKSFTAGTVTLGGNAPSAASSMYNIIVVGSDGSVGQHLLQPRMAGLEPRVHRTL